MFFVGCYYYGRRLVNLNVGCNVPSTDRRIEDNDILGTIGSTTIQLLVPEYRPCALIEKKRKRYKQRKEKITNGIAEQ